MYKQQVRLFKWGYMINNCGNNDENEKKIRYLCFPDPDLGSSSSSRPQFVFDSPGPDLFLPALDLKLYLPALAN